MKDFFMGAFGHFKVFKMCFMAMAIMVFFIAPRAQGQELFSSWEQDKAYLESVDSWDEGHCERVFDVLWHWSKQGNMAARRSLLMVMTALHGHYLTLPNASLDMLTFQRSVITLAAHSLGDYATDEPEDMADFVSSFYRGVRGLEDGSKFANCVAEGEPASCVQQAVDDRVVASFENFAREVDMFSAAGYSAQCPGLERSPHEERATVDYVPQDQMDVEE